LLVSHVNISGDLVQITTVMALGKPTPSIIFTPGDLGVESLIPRGPGDTRGQTTDNRHRQIRVILNKNVIKCHEITDFSITNQQSLYCCSLMKTNSSVNHTVLLTSTTFYVVLAQKTIVLCC